LLHYRSRIDELSRRSKEVDASSEYNPKVIAASHIETLEGEAFPHLVMYEFENIEVATKWYYDDGGKDVAELRKQITKGWISIISGYEAG